MAISRSTNLFVDVHTQKDIMNYSDTDKMIDDMEPEIDSLYKMIILLYQYDTYNDIIKKRKVTKERYSALIDKKKAILTDLCTILRTYKVSEKKPVSNPHFIENRGLMAMKLSNMYMRIISECFEIDQNNN